MVEVFGQEMTAARGCCANCGAVNAMAALLVFHGGPGDVMRCPACETVVVVISSLRDGPRVHLVGPALVRAAGVGCAASCRTGREDAMKVGLLDPPGLEGRVRRLGRRRRVGSAAWSWQDRPKPWGFESIWAFDHFHTVPVPTDEITFESFSMLTALAMVTQRVRLGHMVICTASATRR